jgi:hypothetical protein
MVAGEAVGEGVAVVGELPETYDLGAAVGLADDLPAVGRFDGDGQGGAEESGLVRAVGCDGFDVVAEKMRSYLLGPTALTFI